MAVFKDAPPRGKIPRPDLVLMAARMLSLKCDNMLRDEIEATIKRFGVCECDAGCKTPFKGYAEFDHYNPNSIAEKGAKIHWRALTKVCHAKKTNGLLGDKHTAARTKRLAFGNTQYDKREANGGSRMQSGGFRKAPEGHKHFPKKGDWTPNVKVLD